jgi:glutamine amidotransferase
VVTLVATLPLTQNEQWQKMQTGEFNLFRFGERIFAATVSQTDGQQ